MNIEFLTCGDLILWEQHTTKTPTEVGLRLELVGDMPDGKPCVANMETGIKPMAAIQMWHNYVQEEYRARENRQEAEANERAEALRSGGGQAAAPAREHGAGDAPAQVYVPGSEGSVEAILETKVAAVGRSIAFVQTQIDATAVALDRFKDELRALQKERTKAIAALRSLREVK